MKLVNHFNLNAILLLTIISFSSYSIPNCERVKSIWGNVVAYCSCDESPASDLCSDFSFSYWDFEGGFETGYYANTNCQDVEEAKKYFEKYPPKLLKEKTN
jgi:hypothetical protein